MMKKMRLWTIINFVLAMANLVPSMLLDDSLYIKIYSGLLLVSCLLNIILSKCKKLRDRKKEIECMGMRRGEVIANGTFDVDKTFYENIMGAFDTFFEILEDERIDSTIRLEYLNKYFENKNNNYIENM